VTALRAAGEQGLESLRLHGPQLESDEEFDAFLDDAAADALRQ
jgi:toxin ParE1/3/4